MASAKTLEIEIGGSEDAVTTFARDQLAALECADDGAARARVWRRPHESLLLGRFHRMDAASCAWDESDNATGLSRRLSGGRVVPIGPGVACITLVAPVVDWFDPAAKALRPEQVLNRAIRPLLAMLRAEGAEAFYPGRDLVTARGRTIAHTSFTVMRDGVAIVEMHIAETPSFAGLAALLDRYDPAGVAGVDRASLADATSLEEFCGGSRAHGTTGEQWHSDERWAEAFGAAARKTFLCDVRTVDARDRQVTPAHATAARAFLEQPGPLEDGVRSAATLSMLGIAECSSGMRGDRLTGLRITGDLIAPFHTLDDVASECEGEPLRPASIRKALARAMAQPRSFVLGLRELDELILRLA